MDGSTQAEEEEQGFGPAVHGAGRDEPPAVAAAFEAPDCPLRQLGGCNDDEFGNTVFVTTPRYLRKVIDPLYPVGCLGL